MIVEQAVFGEVRGAHALRASSNDSKDVGELASRLDLPDTAPPGVAWSPFLLGFAHKARYVLARTFLDPEANRAGMVLAHALITPLEEIITASDLRPLLALLITEPAAPANLPTLDLMLGDEIPPETSDLAAAATALTATGTGPVIRTGNDGFDNLVMSLWGRLWPEFRRSFAFRLSFGPADLVETPRPALVCTPPALLARWRGHRLLDTQSAHIASSAAALVCGRREGEPLRTFADEMAADLTSFTDLALLEKAHQFSASEPGTISDTLTAVRLIDRLSPSPVCGAVGKANLIDRLVQHLSQASAQDLLTLRNLDPQGFRATERLWTALSRRLAQHDFPPAQDKAFVRMITDAAEESKSTPSWRNAVLKGLSAAARTADHLAKALWRWVEADPAIIRPAWTAINPNATMQDVLAATAPRTLRLQAAQEILELSREQGLHRLHGATAAAAFNPAAAARLQTSTEPAPQAEGIRLALAHATPAEVVSCAISLDDSRIIDLAAERVANTPALLANVDLSNHTAQAIWSASLKHNVDAWRGPTDPRAVFDTILLDLLDGYPPPAELIAHLSLTPLADLTAFTRRSELWPRLTHPARTNMLRATARGWLDQAPGTGPAPEPELQVTIIDHPDLDKLLTQLASDGVSQAIQIVVLLAGFSEQRFLAWLRIAAARTRPFSMEESEAIGRLTQERRWRHVPAKLLSMLRQGRQDVRPALRACLSLVGWWDRLRYGLSAVSADEKWASLETLAANLYPTGPGHNGLWERSGGRDSDLMWSMNGRAQWQHSLTRIRLGGRPPSIRSLLQEMREDFPENPNLSLLVDDCEFRDAT
ncbi:effector-associated domain EAD1-containing protein [Actinomadura sp. 7K534]|uniref:GAP1-N1 domain-containing protein n=1 Tax=Actinomadura sp. 7K534 TaxID=2530366 RepID=UPI001048BB53|nr:effector-associated domain EAD1-containing protein [Actinomadura sp. 7K534]TDB89800.1 hypothetical protein E1266_29120 [Actinomadura sp. 7K534]